MTRRILTFAVVLLHFTTTTFAQTDRALNSFIADQFYETVARQAASTVENLAKGIQAYVQTLDEANRLITNARQQYWKEYDSGVRNGPAEVELGRALFMKDVVLMSFLLSEGRPVPMIEGLTKAFGEIDGGVRPVARAAFNEWLGAIRFVLGADRPGVLIMPTLPQVLSTLEKTKPWYDAYRARRDWAEFTAHGITRPEPTLESPGENGLARVANRPRTTTPREWPLTRFDYIQDSGVRLLRCIYDRGANAPQSFGSLPPVVYFWPDKVGMTRAEIQRAAAANPRLPQQGLLRNELFLGDVAVSACPNNEGDARTLSGRRAPGTIDGIWLLRRTNVADPTLEKLFGSNRPDFLTIRFNLGSATLTASTAGWSGLGRLNGRSGSFDITDRNRQRGRADFTLDESDTLHLRVQLADNAPQEYIGRREQQEAQDAGQTGSTQSASMTTGPPAPAGLTSDVSTPPTAPAPANPGVNRPTAATTGPAPAPGAPIGRVASTVPRGTQLMIRILEPVQLLNPNETNYRAVVERPVVARGETLVEAGSEATVKAARMAQQNSRANVVYVLLTVDSIIQDGSKVPISTTEVRRPAPVPGTQYRGAATLPAQTVLSFTVN